MYELYGISNKSDRILNAILYTYIDLFQQF